MINPKVPPFAPVTSEGGTSSRALDPTLRALRRATSPEAQAAGSGHAFVSGGRSVRVEVFVPPMEGPRPAVLILHGAGGIDSGNRYVRHFAEAIAGRGLVTLLLHYFDRTGTTYAGDATIHREFELWRETVDDAIAYAAALPEIDPQRIGLVGYSLGGYLAMAQAARDRRIRAVVELAGGIDPESAKQARQFPPTLVVHGKEDRRVAFTEAQEVERVLRRVQAEVETRFYPGEGHILSAGSALDALAAGLEFLEKHLAPSAVRA